MYLPIVYQEILRSMINESGVEPTELRINILWLMNLIDKDSAGCTAGNRVLQSTRKSNILILYLNLLTIREIPGVL
jgi:hypothetical protein